MQLNHSNLWIWIFTLLALLLLVGCRRTSVISIGSPADSSQAVLVSVRESDSAEPAIAASPSGDVYVAWINHGSNGQADVMIARFTSDGKIDGSPVRVNPQVGIATAWRGDPPTVAVAPDQTVFVAWTARVESTNHATDVYLSASRDRGQSFAAPVKVNDDQKPSSHGLHSLAIGSDGRIFMAWLDDRNLAPMPAENTQSGTAVHHEESNRELFSSFSTDGGRTFSRNQRVATDVCPCCKTALAVAPDGRVYASWRQVLPGDFRHIAVAASIDGGQTFAKPVIVSDDQWALKGCPVSGPSLSLGKDGSLRVLWYAGAENHQQGIYWSESRDGGLSFAPRQLLAPGFARSTPVLIGEGDEGPLAIWEATANDRSGVHASSLLDVNQFVTKTLTIAEDGELPAAAALRDRILVAYVAKDGEKQSIWLRSIGRSQQTGRTPA
jgi:hypothetical protein